MEFNNTNKMVIGTWVVKCLKNTDSTNSFYIPYEEEPNSMAFFEFLKRLEEPVFCDKLGHETFIEIVSINTMEGFAEIKLLGRPYNVFYN